MPEVSAEIPHFRRMRGSYPGSLACNEGSAKSPAAHAHTRIPCEACARRLDAVDIASAAQKLIIKNGQISRGFRVAGPRRGCRMIRRLQRLSCQPLAMRTNSVLLGERALSQLRASPVPSLRTPYRVSTASPRLNLRCHCSSKAIRSARAAPTPLGLRRERAG
jgi:hypothetical protein